MKILTSKEKWQIIKRSIRTLNNADKWYLITKITEVVLDLIPEFLAVFLTSIVVDAISEKQSLKQILMYALIVVGCYLLLWEMKVILNAKTNTRKFHLEKNLKRNLWEKVLNMDYLHLENTNTQNAYQMAKEYATNNGVGLKGVCTNIKQLAGGIALVILGIILIIPIAFRTPVVNSGFTRFVQSIWGLISITLTVTILEIIKAKVNIKITKIYENVHTDRNVIEANRINSFYTEFVFRHYQNGKDIRTYNEQKLIVNEISHSNKIIENAWSNGFKSSILYEVMFMLINVIIRILMYGFAIFRAVTGMFSSGEVIAFAMYFTKISAGLSEISDGYSKLMVTPSFCKHYFDFLDIPDQKYKGTIPTEKRDDNEYEFEFKDVSFRYPNTEKFVLRHINLKWKIGEKMALVGRNGCGKSTLIKLLCRLYDPTEGVITLNGIDICKYNYDEYMELFSVVFQDSKLFAYPLFENVAASDEVDMELAEDCIRKSGLSERLNTLPKGIETCLYTNFDEDGVEFSGGEVQKICLARAIYKGAPFIILDEPTASLDPISEYEVYTKFNSIVGTRTAIYISHRLSSCRFCDNITVLDKGCIVEQGNHAELICAGGIYANMWFAQAEYYHDIAGDLFI